MAISLSDLLRHVGISEQQLNDRISDDHLNQVSLFLTSWEIVASFLGLAQLDVDAIKAEGKKEADMRLNMLKKWKSENSFRATYRKLVDALLNLKMAEHAEKVCRLLQSEATSSATARDSGPSQPLEATPSLQQQGTGQQPPSLIPDQSTCTYKWFPESDREYIQADGDKPKHEYFHAYDPSQQFEPLQLSFGTVIPKSKKVQRIHHYYKMESKPHGVAVIINNAKFTTMKERKGSEIDERNAVQTFRYLGYDILIYRNLSASGLREVFEILRKENHSPYDSFICCILSHGTKDGVRGSDDKLVYLRDIRDKMNGSNCQTLLNKPKIFFIQACRGEDVDRGIVSDGGDDSAVASDSQQLLSVVSDGGVVSNEADFFFGYATSDGYKAWRDERHGTWYITELCRSLCTKGTHTDLKHIIQEVRAAVAAKEHEGKKMMPEDVTSLMYDVYFFPA